MTPSVRASTPHVIARLERLRTYALRAEWYDVTAVLGPLITDMRKTERERPWPLGRCIWCEIEADRLREAVVFDSGGGPPLCEQHSDELAQEVPCAA